MREIRIDNTYLQYELRRSTKTKISVHIGNTGRVIVCAPPRCPMRDIEHFLLKNSEWLKERLANVQDKKELRQDFLLHTDEIYYLGKKYRIVYRSDKKPNTITEDEIRVYIPQGCSEKERHNLVVDIMIDKAKNVLSKIFWDTISEQKNKLNPTEIDTTINNTPLKLAIKNVKSYYGEYFRKDCKVMLNAKLIMYPIGFIKEVIYHELSHILEFNHSDRFYLVLDYLYPNYPLWILDAKEGEYDKFARKFMEKIY